MKRFHPRHALLISGLTVGSIALAGGMAQAEPYVPAPYTDAQLSAVYPSDAQLTYTTLLDEFSTYSAGQDPVAPTNPVLAMNLEKTLAIHHAASPEQIDRAIVDEHSDMSYTMGDALGGNLGTLYQDAYLDGLSGELPKTWTLLAKDQIQRAGSPSTNPAKNYFNFPRPFVVAPDQMLWNDTWGWVGPSTKDSHSSSNYNPTSMAFPSGHTNQAYWQGTLLATLLPELSGQILARTSEAADGRIVLAKHYTLDVMGGRMMGQASAAARWADPEFRPLLLEASAELHAYLEDACGAQLAQCIAADTAYIDPATGAQLYRERMTYGFPQKEGAAGQAIAIPATAPDLLLTAFPELSYDQRAQVLRLTAIDSGFPLQASSQDGDWERIDLLAAMTAEVVVLPDGRVVLAGDVPTPPTPVTPTPAVVAAPSQQATLPETGSSSAPLAIGAIALIVLGGSVIVARRRAHRL